ncbi:uncharacterized protein LOC109499197 isoform X2 [Felis catus]|uniref:uncharacterized protein LOC109499197 isoform X2 n=1 Tax=Felis catus TaxID=9685 RepID=UPI001D19CEB3|nr:uncharacterized protein LOC109499197 isoform X2 [Felis catus]
MLDTNLPGTRGRTPRPSRHDITAPQTWPSQHEGAGPHSLPAVMSQDPGHSRVSWRPRSSGHGLPPSAGGNMAGDRGVTLFVLLLSCWCHTEPQPINTTSGTVTGPHTALPPNLKNFDDNVAALFDEILVQEILDPSNSSLLMTQRPLPKSTMIMKKKKTYTQTDYKMDINKKHHKKKFSSGKEKRPFFDEEKETLYQIKSQSVLEKIIDSLRRALDNTLKQRLQKHRRLFKGAKHHKGKWSRN